eukprot:gene2121-2009_t
MAPKKRDWLRRDDESDSDSDTDNEEEEEEEEEEADQKAKEETVRKTKEEKDQKAKEEADQMAKEQANQKAKEETERKAKEEEEQKAKQEGDRKAGEKANADQETDTKVEVTDSVRAMFGLDREERRADKTEASETESRTRTHVDRVCARSAHTSHQNTRACWQAFVADNVIYNF